MIGQESIHSDSHAMEVDVDGQVSDSMEPSPAGCSASPLRGDILHASSSSSSECSSAYTVTSPVIPWPSFSQSSDGEAPRRCPSGSGSRKEPQIDVVGDSLPPHNCDTINARSPDQIFMCHVNDCRGSPCVPLHLLSPSGPSDTSVPSSDDSEPVAKNSV